MARTGLIIEDETLLAQELERHYRRDKWRVTVAPTIKDASRLMREHGITTGRQWVRLRRQIRHAAEVQP